MKSGEVMQDATPCVLCGTYGSHTCKGAPSVAPAPLPDEVAALDGACLACSGKGCIRCDARAVSATPGRRGQVISHYDDERGEWVMMRDSERWLCARAHAPTPCAPKDCTWPICMHIASASDNGELLAALDARADRQWYCREAAAMLRTLSAKAPAGEDAELCRLLNQRYADLGDSLTRKAAARIEQLSRTAAERGELLRELVACKDLKDRAVALVSKFPDRASCARVGLQRAKMLEEYERRKPLAWSAARTALAQDSASG